MVDASAAYDLLTTEMLLDRLGNERDLIAPDLVVAELLNARWKVQRANIEAPSLKRSLDFLSRLRIVSSLQDAHAAAALAEKLDHSIYDCFYVALAQRERAKVLTADQRLARKLRANGLSKLLR